MGEKRFKLDIGDDYCFIDNQIEDRTYVIYNDRFKERWAQEIVDLLNEQETTIQEQDKRIKELERMLKKCDAERIMLQNESGAIIKFGVRGGSV